MTINNPIRGIKAIFVAKPTHEGAGVRLNRVFGNDRAAQLDPFLLLDDFRSNDPLDYQAGFPWHPHRGIETISYIIEGSVEHGDSLGNNGRIGPGDVQWMTAGSGIIHQEMPKGDEERRLWGFQLWTNLPARHKMVSPRYQEIPAIDIPRYTVEKGVTVRVICGSIDDVHGPVRDIVTEPLYFDIQLDPHSRFRHSINEEHTIIAYVIEGAGYLTRDRKHLTRLRHCVLFSDGSDLEFSTDASSMRLLLLAGKPIGEPIAWAGPIVMNTEEELNQAFEEFRNGTFIRS